MINLSNYQSYQTYFKAIAEDHKDLDAAKPYLHGDDDVASNESRTWSGKKLWLEPPQTGQVLDNPHADNLLLQRPCRFVIAGAAGSSKFQDEYDFFKVCEGIVIDVIGKIRKDYTEGKVVFDFASIRLGMVELQLGSTKLIGCQMDFTYKDPSGFPYTGSKWKSED